MPCRSRRIVSVLAAGALAGAGEVPVAVALPEPPSAGAAAAWRALPVRMRPDVAVDGDLAEWAADAAVELPAVAGQQRVQGWRGPEDCSAQLWLGQTGDGLLIAVRVRDDRHEALAGDLLWQGDSIQFATGQAGIGPEFGVAVGAAGTTTYRWSHGAPEGGAIRAAGRRGDGVTTYEVAVPWTAVAGGRRPDGLLSFSLLVNDNDGGGRRGYIELTPGIGQTKDPRQYALLAFAGPGPAVPVMACTAARRMAVGADGQVALDAWVYVPAELGPQRLQVRVTGADGALLAAGGAPSEVPAGVLRPVRIAWRPEGGSAVAATVAIALGGARSEVRTEVVGAAALAEAGVRAQAACAALAAAQAALPAPDPYARAALAVAGRTLELAPRKVEVGDVLTAYDDQVYVAGLCDALRAELAAIAAGTRPPRPLPAPDLGRLRIADGNFWSGDQPVMLVGAMGYSELRRDLGLVRDLGFNSVGTDFASGASLSLLTGPDSADTRRIDQLAEAFAQVAGMGFTWSWSPSLHYFPLWALRANPDVTGGEAQDQLPDWSGRDPGRKAKDYGSFFPFSVASPTVRGLVARMFALAMPALARAPGTGVVWLMNEPRYHKDRDPGTLLRFQAFLRQRHGDIATLNARWGTAHADFAAIGFQAGSGDPGRIDYLAFNQREVGDWFSWLGAEARRGNPQALLSNKPMAWTLLAPETGIDFEREALEWDVPGCDAGRDPHDRLTAFNGVEPALLFDFQRSVAPGKPLADHEYHWVHAPGLTAAYSHATFLHSYLHGLRWSQFWVWGTGDLRPGDAAGGSGMQFTAPTQPAVLWGAAQAAIDLRRAARTVAAFPQPAEVAITFSRPNLFRDGGAHRDRLTTAWRAASGLDAPVGFATDRMLAAGLAPGIRLLVVPGDRLAEPAAHAGVQAFLDRGGVVALVGTCFVADAYRQALPALRPGRGRIVQLAAAPGADDAPALAAALEPLLSESGVARPVRLRPADGRPAWPLECRVATVDGRRVAALVGMDRVPRRVAIEPASAWEDVLSGERGDGAAFTLGVGEVRLLRLDP